MPLTRPDRRLLRALACAAFLLTAPGAFAQGLGLGLDLGGLGSVDVQVGGDKGLGLGVDLGGDNGLDLGVDLGGDGGLGVDLGVGGSGNSNSSGGGGLGLSLDTAGQPLGQELALDAVRKHRALPLEDIMLRAQLLTDGQIIDAQLVAVQDILLYELKVLGKAGNVSELYFYAQSGDPVDLN